jgi:hypothetical protein
VRSSLRRPERTFRRLRLFGFQLIYEVAGPRYALRCFATYVEARSPPVRYCIAFVAGERLGSHVATYAAIVPDKSGARKISSEDWQIVAALPQTDKLQQPLLH